MFLAPDPLHLFLDGLDPELSETSPYEGEAACSLDGDGLKHSLVGSPGTLSSAETTQSSRLDVVGRGDLRSLPLLPGTPS